MASPHIEEKLRLLPAAPGCYLMKDADGTIIYVGKAAVLRDRVRSYFRSPDQLSVKNRSMVARIADLEWLTVNSELEALLTENQLIKQHRPKYNVLLKDDKTFPYIKVTKEPFPRVEKTRRLVKDGARYFGPYASAQSLNITLDLLKKLFPYRSCLLNIVPERVEERKQRLAVAGAVTEENRALPSPSAANNYLADSAEVHPSANDRACLDYYIHRCVGPCIGAVSVDEYAAVIRQVTLFLEGKHEAILRQLEEQMEKAAVDENYERAAVLRDQIRAVQKNSERQRVSIPGGKDQDVLGMARADDEMCVQVFHVREGRVIGRDTFTMQGVADTDDGAVLAAFLKQYYDAAGEVPPEILLPQATDDQDDIEIWLADERGKKVSLEVPKIGDKRRLVEMADQNAAGAAEERRLRWLNDEQKVSLALQEIRDALNLPRLPLRMECYDIATLHGTATVGSMVVFENGKPRTEAYRRFHIKTVEGANDFASMAEMLRRRFKRANSWHDSSAGAPDSANVLLSGEPENDGDDRLDVVLVDVSENNGDPLLIEGDDDPVTSDGVTAPDETAPDETAPQTLLGDWTSRPDLIIIDGGKGQLGVVLEVMDQLGVRDQAIAGLAKENEELFLPRRAQPVILARGSQGLFLIQRIRDEAHRFANTFHRNVRGKRALQGELDSVPGIGGKRKKTLITRFGSVSGLRRASEEEIAAVDGIGPRLAATIKEHIGGA